MRFLLVLSHPDERSFNHAIVDRIAGTLTDEGHTPFVHDLYREHFQPVLENEEIRRRFSFDDSFARYAQELKSAAGVIFVYPDWWGMPPAILKGWIDRILRPGIAFDHQGAEFMQKETVPLLTDKRALVVSTTDETNPLSQEAMNSLWKNRVFGYVGIEHVTFKTFYGLRDSTGRDRRRWLQETVELVRHWL